MRCIALMVASTFLLCAPAAAENWKEVARYSGDRSVFIDVDSMREGSVRGRKAVNFWVKRFWIDANIQENFDKRIEYSLFNWSIICSSREYRINGFIFYDNNGRVIYSSSKPFEVESIVPGTRGEHIFEAVC